MAILWGICILIIASYVGARLVGGRRLFAHYDAPVIALGIGLGVCAHLVYVLGLAQLYYQCLFRGATIIGACLVILLIIKQPDVRIANRVREILERLPRVNTWTFWVMIGLVAILLFAVAVLFTITATPTMLIDSYMYHLTVPKAYLGHHGIFAIPYNLCSNYPLMPQMLYVWLLGLMPEGLMVCKTVSLVYIIMLGWLTYCVGRRFFTAAVGLVGMTIIMLTRDVGQFATTAHVDVQFAFYVCLGLYLFMVWALQKPEPRTLGLGSLAFGFALASKLPGAVYLVIGILTLIVSVWIINRLDQHEPQRESDEQKDEGIRRARLGDLRRQVVFLLAPAIVVGMLWWGKNAIVTGNPFYPFFTNSMPTRVEYKQMAQDFLAKDKVYARFTVPHTWQELKDFENYMLKYLRNVYYLEANRMVLFMCLALLLGIIGRFYRERTILWLLVLSAFSVGVFLRSPAWRFLIGLYPLIIVLFWASVQKLVRKQGVFALIAGIVVLLSLKGFWTYNYAGRVGEDSLEVPPHGPMLHRKAIVEYYEREFSHYEWVKFVSRIMGKGDVLLVTENIPELPLLPVAIIPNPHMHSKDMLEFLAEDREFTSEEIFAYLSKLGVTHILTGNRLDGRLAEFQAQHLELVRGHKGMRLFALRPLPKLQLENEGPF
jgi:hypothetical protein